MSKQTALGFTPSMPEEPLLPSTAARKAPLKLRYWFAGFALLAVLGVWVGNERSYARLQAYKQQLIAKGEKLSIADHIPKFPPVASNAAPDFLAAAEQLTKTKFPFYLPRLQLPTPGRALVTWREDELPTGHSPDHWPEVIAHAELNRHLLVAISDALQRPELAFTVDYAKGHAMELRHLEAVKHASDTLAHATVTDLHHGNGASALTNLLSLIRLSALRAEPFEIARSVTIRNAGLTALIATWEALQYPGWSEADLSRLQADWQSGDVAQAWLGTANLSRAMDLDHLARCRSALEWFAIGGGSLAYIWDSSAETSENLDRNWERFKLRSLLRAWQFVYSHDDELWCLRRKQVWLDAARTALQTGAFAGAHARAKAAHKSLDAQLHPMMFGARQIDVWSERDHRLLGSWETSRRMATLAIALHRHRLQLGNFPPSLQALAPKFLAEVPNDFMDGQPFRYRLQPDGQFLLWSVGDDGKDDGGDPSRPPPPAEWDVSNWLKGRDWVWPQPATEAEVAAYYAELAARRAPVSP